MKKILLAFALILLTIICGYAQSLDYSNYHMVFYDDFTHYSPSTFLTDTAFTDRWSTSKGCWAPSGTPTYYRNSYINVSMPEVGVIKLTETDTSYFESSCGISGTTEDHFSGAITTTGYYGYGIVEASMKISDDWSGDGVEGYKNASTAFWSGGSGITEIDILDLSQYANWNNRVIDWYYYQGPPANIPAHGLTTSPSTPILSTDYHLYSCVWTPDSVTFYLDRQYKNSVFFDQIRTYPEFLHWTIALLAFTNTHSGYSMYIDTVRIYRPNCHAIDLDVDTITTFVPLSRVWPGLYKYENIVSNFTPADWYTWGGYPGTLSPIIFEAQATTILPNFIADQSSLYTSTVDIDPPSPASQNANGFLEILPLSCYDISYDNWFRTMSHDSTKPYLNLNAIGSLPIVSGGISISPNPVYSTVNIAYPCTSTGTLEITITDVVGRIVDAETVNCTDGNTVQQSIDMSSYQQGVYFIELTLNSEHVVRKIVKL